MKAKKPPLKKAAAGELTRSFHEILVADKRAYEPFVKVFQAVGENVSKLDLGTLVGVFEVDEKSEDAAYIVNFLASVAKKEYFNNPRRGPIESFEAALHKVNVALAELVKHGNVSWLGKLHGALAVLEKNNLHFSVTGEGAFLLLRQEQFSEISAGLASSEAENHPLKTFVEVSSGRLMEDDTLLLVTPELKALFPLDYLTKQASRMKKEGFRQFLRTALVNEIDMAAVLVIEFGIKPESHHSKAASKKDDSSDVVINAFSGNSYNKKYTEQKVVLDAPAAIESVEPDTKEEFIDEKTGHIYVQGMDMSETPTPRFAFLETLSDMSSSAGDLFSRTFRRQSKKIARFSAFLFWEGKQKASHLKRKTTKSIANLSHELQEKRAQKKQLREELQSQTPLPPSTENVAVLEEVEIPLEDTPSLTVAPREEEPLHLVVSDSENKPSQEASPALLRLRSLYQNEPAPSVIMKKPVQSVKVKKAKSSQKPKLPAVSFDFIKKPLHSTTESLKTLWIQIQPFFKNKTFTYLVIGTIVIGSGLIFFFSFSEDTAINESTTSIESKSAPLLESATQTNNNQLSAEKTFTLNKELVALSYLDNIAYGATPRSIINVETNQEFNVPDIKGEIRYVTPMDDLGLLFILTSQNELLSWSPLTKSFTKNTLTLPENARVTGIGTYLTYLYVLDRGNNQLYRYPRTEGGFTTATNWMKESFELTDTAFLAINEAVALAPSREHLLSFVAGKTNGDFEFQDPNAPINIQSLTTDSDYPFIYALSEGSVLSVWNLDRKLLHTYSLKNAPKDATFITSDPEKKSLIVGNKEGLVSRYTNFASE
jgi:hypothetical protein